MSTQVEQFNLWSSFNDMVDQAEKRFFAGDYKRAIELWKEYAKITGKSSWKNVSFEIENILADFEQVGNDSEMLHSSWLSLRRQVNENTISSYSFDIIQKLYAKRFLSIKPTVGYDLATGIFCFIDDKTDNAIENLKVAVNHKADTLYGRLYLSKSYFKKGEEHLGIAYLTQSFFLAGHELIEEDMEVRQIRDLYGRLKSLHSKSEISAWLTPFEAWHRGWLVWIEDMPFFQLMQSKERNERILQVKYYLAEKYRHFMRCLYIAEYVRHFLPKERGIIWEQEAYMEKLDKGLFERYRKKRKPVA